MSKRTERHVLRALGTTLLVVGGLLVMAQCDLTTPVERHSLVVEAFVETGRPPPTITLRRTRPLGQPGGPRANAARGATVKLVLGGETFQYEATGRRPGQYGPVSGDRAVPARVRWRLHVQWRGERARAQGTTPPPIELDKVCIEVAPAPVQAILLDSLRRDSLDIPAEQGYIYPVDVSLAWPSGRLSAGEDTTHWVRPQVNPDTTESSSRVVSFFLEPIEVRREDRFRIRNGKRRWTGVYAVPVEDSTSAFPQHTLTATVTRGDSAFVAFARSRGDPERREPISNVRGGLGIATAVALDSMRRVVAPGRDRCRSRESPSVR